MSVFLPLNEVTTFCYITKKSRYFFEKHAQFGGQIMIHSYLGIPKLLRLANTKKDRKISRVEALDIIMITTGQRNMGTLENILKRMRKYEIYKGCEAGYSLLIRKHHEIKKFLIDGSLEKNDRKANNQGSM